MCRFRLSSTDIGPCWHWASFAGSGADIMDIFPGMWFHVVWQIGTIYLARDASFFTVEESEQLTSQIIYDFYSLPKPQYQRTKQPLHHRSYDLRLCWHLLSLAGNTCLSIQSLVPVITFRCYFIVAHSAYPSFSPLRYTMTAKSSVEFTYTRLYCDLCVINPLNAELNPICYFLALLGAHHFLHVSRIRVNINSDPWSLYTHLQRINSPIGGTNQ